MDIDQMNIYERLALILSTQLSLPKDKISRTSFLRDDLGADSLDTAEIVMMIKDEFGYDMSDEVIEKMKQVKDIEDLLNEHFKSSSPK